MAFIENRRIKRRVQGIALMAGAAVILCGLIVLAIWLIAKKGQRSSDTTVNTPSPVNETNIADITLQPTGFISTPPSIAPAASQTGEGGNGAVTQIPNQVLEERHMILAMVSIIGASDMIHIEGSYAVRFVNNTKGVMYGAYFDIGAFNVTGATVNGIAARYSVSDSERILVIPFVRELIQFEETELFFSFSLDLQQQDLDGITLPYPAYNTVLDMNAYVTSNLEIEFSEEVAGHTSLDGVYLYRPELTGITKLKILFVKE